MQIVIDIPEEDYIRLRDEGMFGNVTTFKRAVREGIPLAEQEPCDDAISRQAVLNEIYNTDGISNIYFHLADKIIALPLVKPQYTDAEIQKMQNLESAEIQKAYEIGKAEGSEVLDKIRAEIEAKCCITVGRENDGAITLHDVFEIIDKYKASPTGAESEGME